MLLTAWCTTSCYTRRILIGDTQPKEPMVEVSKEHNAHFIGGLVKTAKTVAEEHVGDAENFAVMTRLGFGDIVLSAITAGIYTPTTTKYYIPVRYMDDFDFIAHKREQTHKDKGFVLGVEIGGGTWPGPRKGRDANYMTEATLNTALTFGYRLNPRLYIGVGADISVNSYFGFWYEDTKGRGESDGGIALLQPFARLRYTMLDAKNSPYIGIDTGFPIEWDADDTYPAWSVTPMLGYRFSVGRHRNGAFDIGIGYRIGEYFDDYVSLKYCSLNALLIKIGFSIVL